ncbi:hypothetical protein C8Q75DRAFT_803188 [Abortiporus biennis]|nr:hypothetical protein C8Q75DRAFT_803188 [Abortiporus biennis]
MSETFVTAAIIKQNVTYLDIVAAALLAYDYILTLPTEIKYVWFTPMSFGKMLYFLTRYPVFEETALVLYHQFAVMGPAKCDAVFKTIGFQLGTGTLIAESILAMRTWVIWHRDKRVGWALTIALVGFYTPVFYFLAQALNSLVFTTPPHPNTPGCFLLSQKNILFVVFILITCFETFILVLTLIKFLPLYKHKQTSLIHTIYRDGVANYGYLCILSICNVVVLLTAPHGYSTLLSALQRVLHSIFSSRVLLHLREAASAPIAGTLPTGLDLQSNNPTSAVRFTETISYFMGPSDYVDADNMNMQILTQRSMRVEQDQEDRDSEEDYYSTPKSKVARIGPFASIA